METKRKKNFEDIFGKQQEEKHPKVPKKKPKEVKKQRRESEITQPSTFKKTQRSDSEDSIKEVTLKKVAKGRKINVLWKTPNPLPVILKVEKKELGQRLQFYTNNSTQKLKQLPLISDSFKMIQFSHNPGLLAFLKQKLQKPREYLTLFTFISDEHLLSQLKEEQIVFYSKTQSQNKFYLINYKVFY